MADPDRNLVEDGIPAGTWNKYQSRNPVQNYLVGRFKDRLRSVAASFARECVSALDVGCGEGVTTALFLEAGLHRIEGCDFSEVILQRARSAYPDIPFHCKSIYGLSSDDAVDFVSACEVLEHVDQPGRALAHLAAVCRVGGIVSVPNEPLFRSLNLMAGKYVRDLGNSPGHLNHWSARGIRDLVARYFAVEAVYRPVPWTILKVRPKRG